MLLTGHTGFKGAWLATWLKLSGAEVTGLALEPPTTPNLWDLVRPVAGVRHVGGDIRDPATVAQAFEAADPEVVLHLAAQSLVRVGYRDPVETFDVNVRGTATVLDAARRWPSVRAVVVVTSDKVYDPRQEGRPYDESSVLGGVEPYGGSKACTEIVVRTFRESFFRSRGVPIATGRAGNVIGGGDWAVDRLVPDAVRMLEVGTPVALRNPRATRPWQHVLDPLHGYLLLAERLLAQPEASPEALNFGPHPSGCIPVSEVVDRLSLHWGGAPGWVSDDTAHPAEAAVLTLSSDMATERLGWKPVLDLDTALAWTARWYDEHRRGGDVAGLTVDQIRAFEELSR